MKLIYPADTMVKVPQMAESISEGTLKQWSKREHSIQYLQWDGLIYRQRSATALSRMRRSQP